MQRRERIPSSSEALDKGHHRTRKTSPGNDRFQRYERECDVESSRNQQIEVASNKHGTENPFANPPNRQAQPGGVEKICTQIYPYPRGPERNQIIETCCDPRRSGAPSSGKHGADEIYAQKANALDGNQFDPLFRRTPPMKYTLSEGRVSPLKLHLLSLEREL